jgi:hypothetical protein
MPDTILWAGNLKRLHNQELDTDYIAAVLEGHKLRPDLHGWSYTHAWKKFDRNPSIAGLTINASCDSIADIPKARAKGFDTVVVVPESTKPFSVIDGEKIRVCPAQTKDSVTCTNCMLCFKENRDFTVGFRVHGTGKKSFEMK